MTTIQISNPMKQELLIIMADLQKEMGRRMTYEDVLRRLIDDFHLRMDKRVDFSKKYFGILKGKDIKSHLMESRALERE